ncbi:MAG: hypothetical protein V7K18_28900 [Nostoc sp.]|uniref:hypothetical protein n=1 Tax=Nostoc sp. TaxID=1180 RepID=UPI002FF68214
MSYSSYLNTQDPQIQQAILDFYLKKADRFRAYFPEGEELSGSLTGSRSDFLALEEVSVQPWSGMVDSIVVEGTLTPAAIALIRERGKLDEDSCPHPLQLWFYELINDTEVLLRIADFSVWTLYATLDELQSLEKLKIPVSEWQEIFSEPEEGVTPLPMLESLQELVIQAAKELEFKLRAGGL